MCAVGRVRAVVQAGPTTEVRYGRRQRDLVAKRASGDPPLALTAFLGRERLFHPRIFSGQAFLAILPNGVLNAKSIHPVLKFIG